MNPEPSDDTRYRNSDSDHSDGMAGIPDPASDVAGGTDRILPGSLYSLKEAAELTGVPEGRLRRAILFEDLPAEAVPDDRQYLVRGQALTEYLRPPAPLSKPSGGPGSLPDRSPWGALFFFLMTAIVLVLLVLAASSAPRNTETNRPPRNSQEIRSAPLPAPQTDRPPAETPP